MGYFEERAEALRLKVGSTATNEGYSTMEDRERADIEDALREVARETAAASLGIRPKRESAEEDIDAILVALDSDAPAESGDASEERKP